MLAWRYCGVKFMERKYIKKIIGDNIYLSPISLDDVEEYTHMVNNNLVSVGLGSPIYTGIYSEEREQEVLKSLKDSYNFAVRVIENDELLGNIGFYDVDLINKNGTFGIMLGNEKYYGKGYGKEAINLILDYGFSLLNFRNICLNVFEYNELAYNLYKKVGFKEVGRIRKRQEIMGKFYDLIIMDMLSEEFNSYYIRKEIENRYKF